MHLATAPSVRSNRSKLMRALAVGLAVLLGASVGPASGAAAHSHLQVTSAAATGSVSGTVTTSDGRPLSGGSVRLVASTGIDAGVKIAEDGSYTIGSLPAGRYSLHFDRGYTHDVYSDYATQYLGGSSSMADAEYFDLAAGQHRTNMNASLERGATITGRITLDGAAVELASAMVVDRDGFAAEGFVSTGSGGHYVLRGVPAGEWTVQFWGTGAGGGRYVTEYLGDKPYRSQASYVQLKAGAVMKDVDAVLSRGGSISGRITGPDGEPLAGASAHLESGHSWSTGVATGEASFMPIRTGADGTYSFEGLPPGVWRLFFYAPEGSGLRDEWWSDRPWGDPIPIRLLPEETSTGKDAQLAYAAKTHPWGAVSRVAGADRYDTAVKLSASRFDPGVAAVYLASGRAFPDALSAAPLASGADGPILLTEPTKLPTVVADELRRLQPERIVLLGGTTSISASVERGLRSLTGAAVSRIGGADRFSTSAAQSASRFAPGVPVAYLVNGRDFPDALSAGPLAALGDTPILLANGGRLPAATLAELKRLKPEAVEVIGGGVLTATVHSQITAIVPGYVVETRGAHRYATSARLSESFDYGVSVAYVASGTQFADALAAGPVAGSESGPILLTARDTLPSSVAAELRRLRPDRIVILGGPQAVSAKVEAQLKALSR